QCFGRSQIIAERLFKDHAPPMSLFFAGQIRRAQMINDVAKKGRTGGEIEEVIALRVAVLIDFVQSLRNLRIERGGLKLPANVINPLYHQARSLGSTALVANLSRLSPMIF